MKNTLSKRGFTLLEIMLALAIFAIAGMVCLDSYLISMKHIHLLNENKNKSILAKWKIEELRIEDKKIENDNGIFPKPFEEYEWEVELSDIIITDTEYQIEFVPYKLKITNGKNEYEMIMPFIKTEVEGE